MSTIKGMDVAHVRAGARQLAGQLTTIDHLIGQLSVTAKAAVNPQSYGISPGEQTIAPWSAREVQTAKTELQAARAAIEELVGRLDAEADAQSHASGNSAPTLKHFGRYGASATKSTVSDADLLSYLAGLTAEELAAAIAADPSIADRLAGMSPEMIAEWWNSYEDDQKQALIDSMPQVLGNLEGVEYGARDLANRAYLKIREDELNALTLEYVLLLNADKDEEALQLLASHGYTHETFLHSLDAIDEIWTTLANLPENEAEPSVRQLVSLDLSGGEPLAAISVGDLDIADNVTMLIPGIETTVQDNMNGWTSTAQNLWLDQQRLVKHEQPPINLAVVAWIGYDTPASPAVEPNVFENASAQAGGAKLAHALDGVRATLGLSDHSARLDVVALSYGSTTAFNALSQSSAGTLVVLGSTGPEPGINTASDVNVRPGEVWATDTGDGWSEDWIAAIGRSGRIDPTSDAFGANTFESNGDGDLKATNEHGGAVHSAGHAGYGYLDKQTESLRNIALITLDMAPTTSSGSGSGQGSSGGGNGGR
jgi:hypothetical protein